MEEIRLMPLLSSFDLRVIFAPAVISLPKGSVSKLICGHSIELNATGDLDFFVSIGQLRLLCEIVTSNVSCLTSDDQSAVSSCHHRPAASTDASTVLDSGLGSEASVAVRQTSVVSRVEADKSTKPFLWYWMESSTFDILLTAGRISLMFYDHLPSSGCAGGNGQANDNVCEVDDVSGVVDPLLHVSFYQPHSFIVCEPNNQKIELSCYDMSVRGPMPLVHGTMSSDEPKLLPDAGDFAVHWMETKPGKIDAKTGIPACLYTLKITNYLSSSGISLALLLSITSILLGAGCLKKF